VAFRAEGRASHQLQWDLELATVSIIFFGYIWNNWNNSTNILEDILSYLPIYLERPSGRKQGYARERWRIVFAETAKAAINSEVAAI